MIARGVERACSGVAQTIRRIARCLGAAACFGFLVGAQPSATLGGAWLKAYNAGDKAALMALGDDSLACDRDGLEETGGLTLVCVESDDGATISALLKEHDSQ